MKNKQLILSLVFGLLGGSISVGGYALFQKNQPQITVAADSNGGFSRYAKFSANGAVNFTTASAIATPAVVHIKSASGEQTSSRGRGQERGSNPFPFDFFDNFDMRRGPSQSSGSGVIISADGYIVTNNHVVDEADKIEVVLSDNRTYVANVIGTDPSTDLALLKIDAKELPALKFANSDQLQVGEWVLAVGNPFNLTSTVTAGIVSAKGRNINILDDKFKIESFIQTDAAVNPGNSGGALINIGGELVGINTAIASQTGSYSGYSFAVPANIARKVIDDLLQFGTVQRGFLGVSIQDINSQLSEDEGLSVSRGIYINSVNENSAAEAAGMKKGDVILKVDEASVNSSSELQEQIGRHRPGDNVKITALRSGKETTFNVVLKNQAGNTSMVKKESNSNLRELGAEFEEISSREKSEFKVSSGVKVTKLMAGKFRSAGIREGFVITAIDKKVIKTESDITDAIKGKEGAVLVEGTYGRGGKMAYAIVF